MARPGSEDGERRARDGAGVRLPYVAALDGLRGVAVLAVLLYHSGFSWARGGYLGVSTFFTLSGFLITALLLRERESTGRIALREFWARRARRLVPAILLLFGLVVVYLAVAARHPGAGVFDDGLASLTWVANWRFISAGRSYDALFSDPSPFLHMWSLAVEEQFYLFLPLVTVLLLGRRGQARRRRFAIVLGVAIVASTMLSALLHPAGSSALRSYYGTDTRAAEPMVGALLAVLVLGRGTWRTLSGTLRVALEAVSVVAAAGLLLLMMTVRETSASLYRGGFLLVAVLAAIVIAAATQPGSLVARALAWRPAVGLGRISYGTYLFHWPLFLWLSASRTGLHGLALFGVRFAVTLVVATASYRFVEAPVRAGRLPGRVAIAGWANAGVGALAGLALAGTALAPATVSGFALTSAAPPPPPPPPPTQATVTTAPATTAVSAVPATVRAASAVHSSRSATAASPAATATKANRTSAAAAGPVAGINEGPVGEAAPPPSSSTTPSPTTPTGGGSSAVGGPTSATVPGHPLRIAVVGDSMADGLGKALTNWAKGRTDATVYDLGIPGCPISRGGTRQFPDGLQFDVDPSCGWWSDPQSSRSQYFTTFAPDVVFLQDGISEVPDRKLPSWPDYRHPGQPLFDSWMINEYQAAIKTFSAGGATVVFGNAVCVDWERMAHWNTIQNPDQRVQSINGDYNVLLTNGIKLLDLAAQLCPNGQFSDTVHGVSDARPDGYHLSDAAAAAVVSDWLGPTLLQQKPAPASTP